MKLTNDHIYKIYKHGGDLRSIPLERIFKALKSNYLQVVMVKDTMNLPIIYNYIPEENKFYKVI